MASPLPARPGMVDYNNNPPKPDTRTAEQKAADEAKKTNSPSPGVSIVPESESDRMKRTSTQKDQATIDREAKEAAARRSGG